MTDPVRLADVDASVLARTMLTAARHEIPSDAAFERTVAALGVSAVVLGASATAGIAAAGAAGAAGAKAMAAGVGGTALTGVAKLAPSGLALAAVKWVGIGAVGGVLAAGVVDRVSIWNMPSRSAPAQKTLSTLAGSERVAPVKPKRSVPLAPAVEANEVFEPPAKPALARSVPAATVQGDIEARRARLAAEVAAVDRAREAMARGDAAETLVALDAYERGFSEQRLRPEALYLRMEALVQRGDAKGARSTASSLLAADPHGPHAARARAVLTSGQ